MKYIIGNWKMNGNTANKKSLFMAISKVKTKKRVIICPPFTLLTGENYGVKIGAQDISQHENGAYTGDISGQMLKDCGAKYVIVGHSERRIKHGETNQIVKAKSEMLSYLHTMGLTEGQINSFNSALDRTADRFQRINKYNIGETVANIGLEFDLSAKEMEKAMSVTSMITSEYLRAGRSADEASLAVKDILQGQFQRLSRETGIKGEQLKEAGWSGDENDVLGLMEALEKVAKARHWDTFAEKASSLNDIVLITQNRLSEWATDMSEGIVPMITDAFNFLVATVDGVTMIFGRIGEALHIPDWGGTALLITGVGLALTGLLTATITARTGLGLLDIKHQGLTQSIIATIFNIKAVRIIAPL